jgi:hypothetical protein
MCGPVADSLGTRCAGGRLRRWAKATRRRGLDVVCSM